MQCACCLGGVQRAPALFFFGDLAPVLCKEQQDRLKGEDGKNGMSRHGRGVPCELLRKVNICSVAMTFRSAVSPG